MSFREKRAILQENPPSDVDDPTGIEFQDCANVEFVYNLELLDTYVRDLPDRRLYVQFVYWKR